MAGGREQHWSQSHAADCHTLMGKELAASKK